jgi:DNA (cytosine-5)-methyltransferase 1
MKTVVINTKIGTAKGGSSRIWLEGQKLIAAGLRIGTEYFLRKDERNKRLELVQAGDGVTGGYSKHIVNKRERNGVISPLLEVRTDLISVFFAGCEKVRVAIRAGSIIISALQIDVKIKERVDRLKRKLADKASLAIGSLFMGGGVLDKGLHAGLLAAGVASFIQLGVEIDSNYLDAAIRNNPELWGPESIAMHSDVRDVCVGEDLPQLDALFLGLPCTSSSVAGRAKNKNVFAEDHSTAGTLFYDMLSIVQATQPVILVMENVVPFGNTAGMTVIRSVLNSLGYITYEAVLGGAQFGVIEDRKRMVVFAVTKGLSDTPFQFPNTHPRVVPGVVAKLGDYLEDVPLDSPLWKPFQYLVDKEERDLEAGKTFKRQLVTSESTVIGTIGRGYGKGRSTEPFVVHPLDPNLFRLLTPVEHARVKGVPESVIDGLSATIAQEVLGQGVVLPKFEAVGASIGAYIQGSPMPSEYFSTSLVDSSSNACSDTAGAGDYLPSPYLPQLQFDLQLVA